MKHHPIMAKLRSFTLLVGNRLAGAGAMFVINLLIARHYGAESLASYALFISAASLIAILLAAGYNSVAPHFIAQYAARGETGMIKGYLWAALQTVLILSGMALAAAVVIAYAGEGALPPAIVGFAFPLVLTAVALGLLFIHGAAMVGMREQAKGLFPETFLRPLSLLIGTSVIVAMGLGMDMLFWFFAAASWLALAAAVPMMRAHYREIASARVERNDKEWRRAAHPWLAISLVWDFMIDAMLLAAALFALPLEIAILHICFRLRVLAGFGMRSINLIALPDIAGAKAKDKHDEMGRKIALANAVSLIYAVGSLAFFLVAGPLLLDLFGVLAPGALAVLMIVSSVMISRAVFGPAPAILALFDASRATAGVMLAGFALALIIMVAAYPWAGVMAIAAAYTFANLTVSFVLWLMVKKRTGIDCSIYPAFGLAREALALGPRETLARLGARR